MKKKQENYKSEISTKMADDISYKIFSEQDMDQENKLLDMTENDQFQFEDKYEKSNATP